MTRGVRLWTAPRLAAIHSMRNGRRWFSRWTAMLVVFVWPAAVTLAAPAGGQALRELTGTVDETLVTRDEDGTKWLELTLDAGAEGSLSLRVAPVAYLEGKRFSLRRGQTVRVRYFIAGNPPVVERIHVLETGRSLRVRCLRGEPVWGLRHGRGPGPRGRRGGSG